MKALIPAAGYATRLYPLTRDFPKPLLDISGRPMIEHIISKIADIPEINEIIVVTNAKFFANFDAWKKNFNSKTPITILNDGTQNENEKLGAIGDFQFAIEKAGIKEDLLIINADNLFNFDLLKPYSLFKSKKSDIVCFFDIGSVEEARKMGVGQLDSSGRVIDFVEKPPEPKTTLMSTGIYFYKASTVQLIKKYLILGNPPDKPGSFVSWLYKEVPVFGFVPKGKGEKWFDIGSFEALEEARKTFAGK